MPTFKRTSNYGHEYRQEVWYAIGVFEGVSREFLGKPVIITSLKDGTHKENSLHYKGLAFDVRTRNMTGGEAKTLFENVKLILDPQGYDTVFEGDHIHCEFDPKLGEEWARLSD